MLKNNQEISFYWLAISLKEDVKLDKKPILMKIAKSSIQKLIEDFKSNSKNENYLFHIKDNNSQIFFFSKDIYFIKISPVKPDEPKVIPENENINSTEPEENNVEGHVFF